MRLVDQGRTLLLWVPGEDGIADVAFPTLTELTDDAVVDLTPIMVTTYEVRGDNSDTTNERAVSETANVVAPTVDNYMGTLQLFRDWDAEQEVWNAMRDALAVFGDKEVGHFARRSGLPRLAPLADSQELEVYKFLPDTVQMNPGTGQGYLKATVPLLQQGSYHLRSIIGGAS